MIKHLVLWKLRGEVKNEKLIEKVTLLQKKFAAMNGVVAGLLHVELCEIEQPNEYDLCLYTEFTDKKSLETYKPHPLHMEIKELSKDWVFGKLVLDYEVPDKAVKITPSAEEL